MHDPLNRVRVPGLFVPTDQGASNGLKAALRGKWGAEGREPMGSSSPPALAVLLSPDLPVVILLRWATRLATVRKLEMRIALGVDRDDRAP
jgi:hypothetical protein